MKPVADPHCGDRCSCPSLPVRHCAGRPQRAGGSRPGRTEVVGGVCSAADRARPARRRPAAAGAAQCRRARAAAGRTPSDKGVWLPGPGHHRCSRQADRPAADAAVGAQGVRGSPDQRVRAAHALQAVRRRPRVPDALRRRVRRAARAAEDLHLRHRRAAHLPHDLHGRPLASDRRRCERRTAIRSAGGKATRSSRHRQLQRRLLVGSQGPAAHRAAAHASNAGRARTTTTMDYEAHRRRPRRLHRALDDEVVPTLGSEYRAVRVRLPAGRTTRTS